MGGDGALSVMSTLLSTCGPRSSGGSSGARTVSIRRRSRAGMTWRTVVGARAAASSMPAPVVVASWSATGVARTPRLSSVNYLKRTTCGSWSLVWSWNSELMCTTSYSGFLMARETRMWSSVCELPSYT